MNEPAWNNEKAPASGKAMAANPACARFVPQLSPYIDGELAPGERTHVEQHLAACRTCTARVADLRAESGLLRVGLDFAADDVDFKAFTQEVMARITPDRPPLLERFKLSLSEMFLYQRTAMVSSFATAAVLVLVAIPFFSRSGAPEGYASERMTVQSVKLHEEAHVAPVVMETDNGSAIIWLVDRESQGPGSVKAAPRPRVPDESTQDELELEGPVSPAGKALAPQDAAQNPQGGEL